MNRMPLRLVIGFIVAVFLHPSVPSWGQENLPAIIKQVGPSIVSIITFNPQGNASGQGSGFFVNREGDVITSRHVLEGASRAQVITSEGKQYAVKNVVAEDSEGDLVRISLDLEGDQVQPLPVSSTYPEAGERVFVIGTPLGLDKTVSDGIVSAVRDVPRFGKIVQVTAPISPGSSGSPVVNMKGEVVGIATFFIVAGQNLNFAIPGERISRLAIGKGESLAEREGLRADAVRSSVDYLYNTGLRYLWAEDYERALPHFVEVVKQDPKHAEAYFQIGYCMAKLGKYPEAIESYRLALGIRADDVDVHNNICVAYNMIGRYPEAIASCRQALQIKPDFAEAFNNIGWALHRMGRYPEAIESCLEAIRLKPDFAMAHYNLGNSYVALKRFKEAVESFKQAIRIKFDYAEAHLNLGAAYNETGRYEEAIASYREAARLKPDLAEAHFDLGMTYLKTGNRGAALDEYKVLKGLNQEMGKKLFDLIYE